MKELKQNVIPPTLEISGVIFDFDGVIVDSLPTHLAVWSRATEHVFGQNLRNPERLRGLSTLVIAGKICEELRDPSKVQNLVKTKQELLLSSEFKIPILPGVYDLMTSLEEAEIPFGIASNAPPEFVKNTASMLDLPVQVILGRGDAARNKPHPDVFLKCAKLLGLDFVSQRTTLVFEDSLHGLKAATKWKFVAVGVSTQFSKADLLAGGANFAISNLKEFVEKVSFKKTERQS